MRKKQHVIDVLVDEIDYSDREECSDAEQLPSKAAIAEAVRTACEMAGYADCDPELCIRFADDDAVRLLNQQWRHQDRVTDVLSFPMQEGPDFDWSEPLGDIALAMPFVLREARSLGLPLSDHCLHLIIHACLHILGFDHIDDQQAIAMQRLEHQTMHKLGLHDPYPDLNEETP